MKVLLAVDGSENSLRAAGYAANLAELIQDCKITIIHVDSLISMVKTRGVNLPVDFNDLFDPAVKKGLDKIKKIFSDRKIPYDTKVLEDYDIAEAICEYAKFYNYDLIIMGSRGLGGIKGLIMGSVSNKVLHLAPCPVTIVR